MNSPTQAGLCSYFGIDRSPFSIAPDPRFLYLGAKHQEALAHLFYGIGNDGGFIVLTGEVGTGKTTLCRALLQQLPATSDVAFIVNPALTANELLQTMCDELGVDCSNREPTGKLLLDALTRHLLGNHSRGRHTVLIIDEAQSLSPAVLEQIRLLTNLETDDRKLLQLVLIGQPELGETLASDGLRQLAQRVTARYHLPTLTRAETAHYVDHRLKVAGYSGRLFSAAALRQVYRATRGTPRLINRLCERCMLGAYVAERRDVGRGIVRRARVEVQGVERHIRAQGARRRLQHCARRFVAPALLLVAVMAGAVALAPAGLHYGSQALMAWQQQWRETESLVTQQQYLAQEHRKQLALARLAALWRIELPQGMPLCEFLRPQPLSCLQLELSAEQLQRLAVPGVVAVSSGDDREYRLLTATSDVASLPQTENAVYTFWMLWRQPPRVAALWPYRPGDHHVGVEWLQERLAWWRGEPHFWLRHRSDPELVEAGTRVKRAAGAHSTGPHPAGPDVIGDQFDWLLKQVPLLVMREQRFAYSLELEQEVKAVQRALGWSTTGVADLLTLIKLDTMTNSDSPPIVTSVAWADAG